MKAWGPSSIEPAATLGGVAGARTSVLIADNTPIIRSGVREVLAHAGDFAVVEAHDLDGVLAWVRDEAIDIALIDMDLPPLGAAHAVARVLEVCETHPVVWSFTPTAERMLAAIGAGAEGCLWKGISADGLLSALRGIACGEAPFSRSLTADLVDGIHKLQKRTEARERAASLSARELEVLKLVASGLPNRQVAESLFISELTVKRHVQNILEKLELSSRHSAASVYRAGFIDEAVVLQEQRSAS